MKANTIYLLQALGFFLQTINASISGVVHNPTVSMFIAAGVGAFQFYMQHVGIQMPAPEVKK